MDRFFYYLLPIYFFLFPLDPAWEFLGFWYLKSHIFLGLAIFVFVLTKLKEVKLPFIFSFLLLFLILFSVSFLWTNNLESGVYYVFVFLINLCILLVVINFFCKYNKASLSTIIISYSIGCFLLGVLSISYFFRYGTMFGGGRITFGDYNPSWAAAFHTVGILLLLYYNFKNQSKFTKVLRIFLLAFLIVFLVLTQGRNSILALVIILVINSLNYFKKESYYIISKFKIKKATIRNFLIFVTISLFLIFFSYILIFNILGFEFETFTRFQKLFSGDRDTATAGRSTIWYNYLSIIQNYFRGHGIGSSTLSYFNFFGTYTPPHNIFILLFFETGIIGLFLYLIFKLYLFVYAYYSPYKNLALVLSLYLLLISFGNDVLYYRYYWLVLMFLMILVESKYKHKSN